MNSSLCILRAKAASSSWFVIPLLVLPLALAEDDDDGDGAPAAFLASTSLGNRSCIVFQRTVFTVQDLVCTLGTFYHIYLLQIEGIFYKSCKIVESGSTLRLRLLLRLFLPYFSASSCDCHGRTCVLGSIKTLTTRFLSPMSLTSQNRFAQSAGSTAAVPNPGTLSFDPTFCSFFQSATDLSPSPSDPHPPPRTLPSGESDAPRLSDSPSAPPVSLCSCASHAPPPCTCTPPSPPPVPSLYLQVEKLVHVDEPHPLAHLACVQRAVREPRFLRLDPRPHAPRDVVPLLLKGLYHAIDVVLAVVIVDEPSLDADSGMVHHPLLHEPGLVSEHGAHAHRVGFPGRNPQLWSEPRHGYGGGDLLPLHPHGNLDGRSQPGVGVENNAGGGSAADDLLSDGNDVGEEEVLGGPEIPAVEALESVGISFSGGSEIEGLDEDDGGVVAVEEGFVGEWVPLVIVEEEVGGWETRGFGGGFEGERDIEAMWVEWAPNHLLVELSVLYLNGRLSGRGVGGVG
ncbi:hypothetical protein G2W53_024929 [Senna tora]|uniref:Uncharacterized protein n=1 Tax=Senna tora TaxID=362788 RepID=A0A834TDR0_9FABA|nr:hypothetical protein G2W53_024929 [Senna tora]